MAELDPRLIRMLARHFPNLQGLRLICVGALLQSITQVWLATRSELRTMLGGGLAFLFYLGLLAIGGRYYARFGRVVSPSPPDWAFFVLIFVVNIFLSMPRYGFPNFFWMLLSAVPLWVAWDCRPYRWHHIATSLAMLYVAFGRVASPHAGDLAWMAPRMWVFTATLGIAGIIDHAIFVRAMRQTHVLASEAS